MLSLVGLSPVLAQTIDSQHDKGTQMRDSMLRSVKSSNDTTRQFATPSRTPRRGLGQYQLMLYGDTLVVQQLNQLETFAVEVSAMTNTLRRGFDTTEIGESLTGIEDEIKLAKEGALAPNTRVNLRNLVSTRLLLIELQKMVDTKQAEMEKYIKTVSVFRKKRISITQDTSLVKMPSDGELRAEYIKRLVEISAKLRPLDSLLRQATLQIAFMQNRLAKTTLELNEDLDEVNFRIKSFKRSFLSRELQNIWEPGKGRRSIGELVAFSAQKNRLLLKYYVANNMATHFGILLLLAVVFFSIRWALALLRNANSTRTINELGFSTRSDTVVSIFLVVVVAQFFYFSTPDIFMTLLWLVMVGCCTAILWPTLGKEWKRGWLLFVLLLLLTGADYLLLAGNRTERYVMLALAATGIFTGLWALRLHNLKPLRLAFLRFNFMLFIGQELFSMAANAFGRYTLAKTMMAGGYFNLMTAICLVVWVVVFQEYLMLNIDAHSKNERLSSYLNFSRIKTSFLPVLKWAAIVAWLILFLRNLDLYDLLVERVAMILTNERSIGNFTFSLGSILVFFLVIWMSSLLANLISFLLGGDNKQVSAIQKSRFGNVIIIFRIVVLSLGFLLAVAAAGIPIDKITIIIGALGVGIGFGLQTIVNNLVSGIILAFERPISVGDQIEVGGRTGKVKEIGIRSSKVATFEGSEVIIPNGDLLNQHLVNWTLSNNHRRVEIIVGVKYGSNLNLVQTLLKELLASNNHVDRYPEPLVLVNQFGNNSIDFRLLFWADIDIWIGLKSDLMLAIDESFRKHDIEIPFPQQDVYIKQMPSSGASHASDHLPRDTGKEKQPQAIGSSPVMQKIPDDK
jgi:small-conductance mechanosensitive channel